MNSNPDIGFMFGKISIFGKKNDKSYIVKVYECYMPRDLADVFNLLKKTICQL